MVPFCHFKLKEKFFLLPFGKRKTSSFIWEGSRYRKDHFKEKEKKTTQANRSIFDDSENLVNLGTKKPAMLNLWTL